MKNIAKTCLFIVAVMLLTVTKINAQVSVGVGISATFGPPPLPVYVQPPCPVEGYLWEPGYWAWDPDDGDYYWVPGVWVAPPTVGFLWTPSYWGFSDGVYLFHAGYWGPEVGFYGGINYGCGYYGTGFAGGVWRGDRFIYNTAAVRVNNTFIHNTYSDRRIINRTTIVNRSHASFNGPGGVSARPRTADLQAMRQRHVQPTRAQLAHQQAARRDPSQFARANHGRPSIAAMNKVNGRSFNQRGRLATPKAAERMNMAGNRRSVHNIANNRRSNSNALSQQHQRRLTNIPQHQRMQQGRMQQQRQGRQQMQQRSYAQQRQMQNRAGRTQMQQRSYTQQRRMQQQPRMQQRAYTQQRQMQYQPRAQQQRMQPRAYSQPQRMQYQQQRMQPRAYSQPQRMQPGASQRGGQPHQRQR
jgi:hypothetical protein